MWTNERNSPEPISCKPQTHTRRLHIQIHRCKERQKEPHIPSVCRACESAVGGDSLALHSCASCWCASLISNLSYWCVSCCSDPAKQNDFMNTPYSQTPHSITLHSLTCSTYLLVWQTFFSFSDSPLNFFLSIFHQKLCASVMRMFAYDWRDSSFPSRLNIKKHWPFWLSHYTESQNTFNFKYNLFSNVT